MKNLVFKVVLLVASVFMSFNKVEAQKGLQIGFEANPQLSYLVNKADRDSKLYDGKNAVNGHFGISTQYGITDKMGVGLNLLYSFQGSKYDWKGAEKVKSVQYLKIPLMFTLSLPIGDNLMFIGKIGPQVNILIDARLYDQDRKLIENNYKKAFANSDFGGMLSTGVAYKLTDRVCIDGSLRLDGGFIDAEDKSYQGNVHDPLDFVTPSPASSPRANTYNLTLGLTFGIRYTFM